MRYVCATVAVGFGDAGLFADQEFNMLPCYPHASRHSSCRHPA